MLDTLKERVDSIKKLMPLIMDLRNPAMRDRHWRQLMEEVRPKHKPSPKPSTSPFSLCGERQCVHEPQTRTRILFEPESYPYPIPT